MRYEKIKEKKQNFKITNLLLIKRSKKKNKRKNSLKGYQLTLEKI